MNIICNKNKDSLFTSILIEFENKDYTQEENIFDIEKKADIIKNITIKNKDNPYKYIKIQVVDV